MQNSINFQKENEEEFLKRVYWRGIEGVNSKEIRRMAWPYLLGLFEWAEYPEGRLEQFTKQYWEDIEEWRVLEAEVRRRDEEAFRAARARKAASPVREESCEVFEDPNVSAVLISQSLKNSVAHLPVEGSHLRKPQHEIENHKNFYKFRNQHALSTTIERT